MQMTFNLMRWGFPNTAAIFALAAAPFVATLADWQPTAAATARIEAAAICPATGCTALATVVTLDPLFE
jgi:hypothetical protein